MVFPWRRVGGRAAVVLLAAALGAAWLHGQEERAKKPAAAPMVTPEREAAALTFVRQHHGELAELLERLKTNRPAQYRKAIRELFVASEQLAQWRERDPARYELELRAWKARSRVQLLSAHATMRPEAFPESELRAALDEQLAVQLELLKLQRETAAKRLEKLEADVQRIEAQRGAMVEAQLSRLRQAAEKSPHRKPKSVERKPAKESGEKKKRGGAPGDEQSAPRKPDSSRPDAAKPEPAQPGPKNSDSTRPAVPDAQGKDAP